MNRIALITGATAGIGKDTAMLLAENGYDVIITGRRKELLVKVAREISSATSAEILPIKFDVRNREEVESALGSLDKRWQRVDVLINNAGLAAGLDFIQEGNVDDWEQMIDTNIKGILYVTRFVSPGMIQRGSGHIINLSSIAGKEIYEKGGVYCGTKHAVDALTKSMRIDMVKHGIKVTSIAPGLVETEFSLVRFKWDKEKAKTPYKGLTPLTGRDIAETILFVLERPAHVNINDLLIMPTAQANSVFINRED